MKFKVCEHCIGCGLCTMTCPEVFQMGASGLAEPIVDEVDDDLLPTALDAMEGCPVGAITEDE